MFNQLNKINKKVGRTGYYGYLERKIKFGFWENGYHGEEITSPNFFVTKLNYIHQNPVRSGIDEKGEDCVFVKIDSEYSLKEKVMSSYFIYQLLKRISTILYFPIIQLIVFKWSIEIL